MHTPHGYRSQTEVQLPIVNVPVEADLSSQSAEVSAFYVDLVNSFHLHQNRNFQSYGRFGFRGSSPYISVGRSSVDRRVGIARHISEAFQRSQRINNMLMLGAEALGGTYQNYDRLLHHGSIGPSKVLQQTSGTTEIEGADITFIGSSGVSSISSVSVGNVEVVKLIRKKVPDEITITREPSWTAEGSKVASLLNDFGIVKPPELSGVYRDKTHRVRGYIVRELSSYATGHRLKLSISVDVDVVVFGKFDFSSNSFAAETVVTVMQTMSRTLSVPNAFGKRVTSAGQSFVIDDGSNFSSRDPHSMLFRYTVRFVSHEGRFMVRYGSKRFKDNLGNFFDDGVMNSANFSFRYLTARWPYELVESDYAQWTVGWVRDADAYMRGVIAKCPGFISLAHKHGLTVENAIDFMCYVLEGAKSRAKDFRTMVCLRMSGNHLSDDLDDDVEHVIPSWKLAHLLASNDIMDETNYIHGRHIGIVGYERHARQSLIPPAVFLCPDGSWTNVAYTFEGALHGFFNEPLGINRVNVDGREVKEDAESLKANTALKLFLTRIGNKQVYVDKFSPVYPQFAGTFEGGFVPSSGNYDYLIPFDGSVYDCRSFLTGFVGLIKKCSQPFNSPILFTRTNIASFIGTLVYHKDTITPVVAWSPRHRLSSTTSRTSLVTNPLGGGLIESPYIDAHYCNGNAFESLLCVELGHLS